MSVETFSASRAQRGFRDLPVPLVVIALAAVIYVAAAVITGQTNQISLPGLSGLLQRTVGLGLVGLGQTFAILVGSIDLSVAALISSVAVLASYLMQGDPGMIAPAILACLALALLAWFVLAKTRFGAHLYAVGGNPDGAKLAGLRVERFVLAAHVIASLGACVAGLYLAARLQSGTPWIGRDGVYDLESIAIVVIGGTALSGGKGGVLGTLAGVLLFASLDASFNMFGVDAFLKQVLRGAIVIAAVAIYAVRNKGHVA